LTANVVLMPAASAPSATAAPAPTAAPQPAQQPAQQPVEPLQVAAVPDPAEQAAAVVQPVPAAAVTTPSPPAQPEIYAARKNANIRAEPNTGARVLGRLKRDEEIAVTGASADGAWLRVTGSFGTGFVSASLLQRQETQPVVMAPAPAPAPELVLPPANALQLDAALRTDVDRFVANSEKIKTHFRFLAVNGKGDRIGTSTSCKIKKSGWGGFSAEGSCDEGTAREEALRACGSDCRIIYNGANKVGDFEIVWSDVGAATATPTVAATTAEPVAEAPTAETPVADSPAVAASSAALAPSPATPTATAPAASAQGGGSVLVLSESLRRDVERFIENSKEIKTHFRFLAVNGKGDRIGTSTSCKIKKSGWGGFSAEGNCDEGTAREEALRACGSDCRIIYNGANKVGDFELAWQ
ncbi:SH3 domain-containing protein, partial [Dongia mobilis]